jgi:hypothetical protein
MRVLVLELIFSFLGELGSSSRFPTNIDYKNYAPLELLDFSIDYFYWLFCKLELVVKRNLVERDYRILLE